MAASADCANVLTLAASAVSDWAPLSAASAPGSSESSELKTRDPSGADQHHCQVPTAPIPGLDPERLSNVVHGGLLPLAAPMPSGIVRARESLDNRRHRFAEAEPAKSRSRPASLPRAMGTSTHIKGQPIEG